jgi:thioredoxin 1
VVRPLSRVRSGHQRASRRHLDVIFATVDVDAERKLAAALHITAIPTLMAFRDGTLVFDQPGAPLEPGLEDLITTIRNLDLHGAHREVAGMKTKRSLGSPSPGAA